MINLQRSGYREIRKKVRSNIRTNSRKVFEGRFSFSSEKVLMGGIIVRKKKLIESSGVLKTPNMALIVFDFSGEFEVCGFTCHLTDKVYQRLFSVVVGEVIYVIGEVIPIETSEGYFIIPDLIMSESELSEYRRKGDEIEFQNKT